MNTLSKQITRRFFRDEGGYHLLQRRMSALMRDDKRRAAAMRKARKQAIGMELAAIEKPGLTAAHHLLYMVLRGKDWRKAFSPCVNATLLANGVTRWRTATLAIRQIHSDWHADALLAPFADLLAHPAASGGHTSQERPDAFAVLSLIRRLVPLGAEYDWQADLDTCPAYAVIREQAVGERTP